MLDKIRKTINELETLGYKDFRVKMNTKTLDKIPTSKNIIESIENPKDIGYVKYFTGISVVIDESIKNNEYKLEVKLHDKYYDVAKISNILRNFKYFEPTQ